MKPDQHDALNKSLNQSGEHSSNDSGVPERWTHVLDKVFIPDIPDIPDVVAHIPETLDIDSEHDDSRSEALNISRHVWQKRPIDEPEERTLREQSTWTLQERYLQAFAEMGVISRAADTVGIHERTPYRWAADDILGFRERLQRAHDRHADYFEMLLEERIKAAKPGQDQILTIFHLKALRPEKYRDQAPADLFEDQREWLRAFRRTFAAARDAVDTEARDVSDVDGAIVPHDASSANG